MSSWSDFPSDYRSEEIQTITAAVKAGECVAIVGLSGAGKSNLLGYLAERVGRRPGSPPMYLVDCNRLTDSSVAGLFRLIRSSLGDVRTVADEFHTLNELVGEFLRNGGRLCLLLDRFDLLVNANLSGHANASVFTSLRALRDAHKYALTYVIASRHPLEADNELAELFFANTLWLGPLNTNDAVWNVESYATRKGLDWDDHIMRLIVEVSAGYPSLLRAVCEAFSTGAAPDVASLSAHPAVRRRVNEFWSGQPGDEALLKSGLSDHPLLATSRPVGAFDTGQLTAKEHQLWEYLTQYPHQVCEKDALIRAVWPEDQIYEQGIRDDSLAQLVRRLREKIESDASNPRFIQTVPGRGYRYSP